MFSICSSDNFSVRLIAQSQNRRNMFLAFSLPVYNQASRKPAYILCTLYQGTHHFQMTLISPFLILGHKSLPLGTPPTYSTAQSGCNFPLASWHSCSSDSI